MSRLSSAFRPLAIAIALASSAVLAHGQITYTSYSGNATVDNQSSTFSNPGQSASAGGDEAFSNTSVTVTSSQMGASFFQGSSGGVRTGGVATINFTAQDGTTYSILDTPPVFSGDLSMNSYAWDLELIDTSADMTLFQDFNGEMSGSLTGMLLAGDSYEFYSYANMSPLSDPLLSYSPVVNFAAGTNPAATPEPSSLVLLCTGLTGVAAAFRRRLDA